MLVDVKMPKLGESLTEGTVIKWWKKVGDFIQKDETILEVSTDKVDSEIPSPVEGVLREILAGENQTVLIDEIIARVESDASAAEKVSEPTEEKTPAPERRPVSEKKEVRSDKNRDKNKFYSPLVLNIARKENVSFDELDKIVGHGRNGRVTKKDLLNYLKDRESQAATEKPEQPLPETKSGTGEESYPLDAVRKQMAIHMRQSLDSSAHVYSVSECDMTHVMNFIEQKKDEFFQQEGFKLSVTPFILTAVTRAIQEFPLINSSFDGERITEKRYLNLGVAVAAKKGLIVPVVKNAEEMSFKGVARKLNELVGKARQNTLTLNEIQGSTFTITNFGVFGNILGLPIINQPNSAILGIGAIKKRPVVLEGPDGDSIGIRKMSLISMSFDHRIIDGELGGRFLQRIVDLLEKFDTSIV